MEDTTENLARRIEEILRARGWTVACAESCTGGLVTSLLTDIPGSSDVVKGSVVSYTNAVKHGVLGVRQQTLDTYGAVSTQTAEEMADGVRRVIGTDIAVSITGNAGPGASEGKPVGLVYFGVSTAGGTQTFSAYFSGARKEIKVAAAKEVLKHLLETLENG